MATDTIYDILLGGVAGASTTFGSVSASNSTSLFVKPLDHAILINSGKIFGYSVTQKFGLNSDIDTATVPEDLWGGSGVYTGFPTGAGETVELVSSSASDTNGGAGAWTVTITGLDTNWAVQTETITLNGLTPVASVGTYRRVNLGKVLTSGSSNTAFNVGDITCRHTTTTANVFFGLPAGTNQVATAAYTIPAGYTGYLLHISGNIQGGAGAGVTSASGYIWQRDFGKSPRLRRPFTLSNSSAYFDNIYGGLTMEEKTDVILRITSASANNISAAMDYEIVLIQN